MIDGITVITITKNRVQLLRRAIESVRLQDCGLPITHLIIIDGCQRTLKYLRRARNLPENLIWIYVNDAKEINFVPRHLAYLRNRAVDFSNTRWISFLDDDNEFEPNHLSSLLEYAKETDSSAVHSIRKLFHQNGAPYLEHEWPWHRNKEKRREIYKELCKRGVFVPGSNIEYSRCDPIGTSAPIRIVDTSEWLLERCLLLKIRFPMNFTYTDYKDIITEDDKFLRKLVSNRIPIISTRLPTLKYYLGGYSNCLDDSHIINRWWKK